MNYFWKMAFLSTAFVLTSCGGSGSGSGSGSSSVDPNTMIGVAATGAPIVSGTVEVKGANGVVVNTKTDAAGAYQVGVSTLSEPFIVKVTSPSGLKLISAASKDDLSLGKKINVTPLTHIIVANVFHETSADNLFENFQTKSSDFTKEKLKEEKDHLLEKFKTAGLVGASGVIKDNDVDLLNGTIVAGSSSGIDGLLDVIDVKTDASVSAGIEIKIKGETTPIITDEVDGTTPDPVVTPVSQSQLNTVQAQLSVIDKVKTALAGFSATYSSNTSCNGPAATSGTCEKNALKASLDPYFHSDFMEDGYTNNWSWFCKNASQEDATSADDCDTIDFQKLEFKDVSLVKYDDATKIATVSINVYVDGKLDTVDDELRLKLDSADQKFKFFGNGKTFDYWIETQSRHTTNVVTSSGSTTQDDNYEVNLNLYLGNVVNQVFTGDVKLTLSSESAHNIFPNNSSSANIYLLPSPSFDQNGVCSVSGYRILNTDKVFSSYDPNTSTTTYKNFSDACRVGQTVCECLTANPNYSYYTTFNSYSITLSENQILNMDKRELIRLQSVSGSSNPINETFYISKPLMINALNAASYVPSFGRTAQELCSLGTDVSYSLSAPYGYLNYARVWHSYISGSQWGEVTAFENYGWSNYVKSAEYQPQYDGKIPQGAQVFNSQFYSISHDEFNRQFVRHISCIK